MNQFAKMNKDKHLRGTRMKNFLKINLLSLTIFFTACNQLHIEDIAEIHGYYATDDNEFIVIVSPEYLASGSARSAAYRKKHKGLHGNLWVNQCEIHQNPPSVKRQSGITAPLRVAFIPFVV